MIKSCIKIADPLKLWFKYMGMMVTNKLIGEQVQGMLAIVQFRIFYIPV